MTEELSFDERVYKAVKRIPRGKVSTYGQIARVIGNPRASRGVGFALHRNPYPGVVPCHRVVKKSGGLAEGFIFGGPGEQRSMLEAEGVIFCENEEDRVDMEKCFFDFKERKQLCEKAN